MKDDETIEDYIARYGEPLLRFKPTGVSEKEILYGDIPAEIAVFRIDHPTKIMCVGRSGRRGKWLANWGERIVIAKSLGLIQHEE
jgi:hypothetical protein